MMSIGHSEDLHIAHAVNSQSVLTQLLKKGCSNPACSVTECGIPKSRQVTTQKVASAFVISSQNYKTVRPSVLFLKFELRLKPVACPDQSWGSAVTTTFANLLLNAGQEAFQNCNGNLTLTGGLVFSNNTLSILLFQCLLKLTRAQQGWFDFFYQATLKPYLKDRIHEPGA